MTTTQTPQADHRFTTAGCINQWHADHDDAECYAAFKSQDLTASVGSI